MSDIDDPVKIINEVRRIPLSNIPQKNVVEFQLSKNEFINDNASFGFIRSEVEPIEFLTFDSERVREELDEHLAHIVISLSDIKYFKERKSYTIFTLLGDLGGFNSAIIILPTFIMTRFSEAMYTAAIK